MNVFFKFPRIGCLNAVEEYAKYEYFLKSKVSQLMMFKCSMVEYDAKYEYFLKFPS